MDYKPVIVYDGACRFCQRQISRIRRWDHHDQFEYAAKQTPGLDERFPRLTEGDFNTGMRLIDPGGEIHVGADAVYQIARRLPRGRWLAWVYRVPVLHGLAKLAYAWVAARRQRLGQTCDNGSCEVTR